MLASLAASAAKAAARAAAERAKARDEFLKRAGYRCALCDSDQIPVYETTRETLTLAMWLRGGLLPWLFRRHVPTKYACPVCHQPPADLHRWLAGSGLEM